MCLLHLPATATSRIYSSFTCSHNFLAKRRALNDSKRLLSFFGLHGSLSKGKEIFGRVRRRKGKLAYFSLARAHACAQKGIKKKYPAESRSRELLHAKTSPCLPRYVSKHERGISNYYIYGFSSVRFCRLTQ